LALYHLRLSLTVQKKSSTQAAASSSQINSNDDNVEDLTMSPEEASNILSEVGLPVRADLPTPPPSLSLLTLCAELGRRIDDLTRLKQMAR
jgi:hypothetical protein